MATNTTSSTEGIGEYHHAVKLSELKSSGKMRVTIEDRVIALFYVNGRVHALDHFCYRKSDTSSHDM